MLVKLTKLEFLQAAQVGVVRQLQSLSDGKKDSHGFKGDPWAAHILGAVGEAAAAAALDVYWSGHHGRYGHGPDLLVGTTNVHVRCGKHPKSRLVIRPGDVEKGEGAYVLVLPTEDPLTLDVCGYFDTGWVTKEEHWASPGGRPGAYFIPREQLRPLSDLRETK